MITEHGIETAESSSCLTALMRTAKSIGLGTTASASTSCASQLALVITTGREFNLGSLSCRFVANFAGFSKMLNSRTLGRLSTPPVRHHAASSRRDRLLESRPLHHLISQDSAHFVPLQTNCSAIVRNWQVGACPVWRVGRISPSQPEYLYGTRCVRFSNAPKVHLVLQSRRGH